jgi:transitional endoplasmic reticulum ATPase
VLLYGPPGTGKTLLAKAVATDASAHFLTLSLARLVHSGVGESTAALRGLFRSARRCRPAVVFLDEVDALFAKRDDGGGGGHAGRLVSQLLLEFEDLVFRERQDGRPCAVAVLAATNRPEALDAALFSSGRFERAVYVGLPDRDARRDIFRRLLRAVCREPEAAGPSASVSRKGGGDPAEGGRDGGVEGMARALAERTEGLSGADIAAVCRAAALKALVDGADGGPGQPKVARRHIEAALAEIEPSVHPGSLRALEAWRMP